MITLICTKCKATLEMDDAFAGGVCRCQYCGTIQTVPSHLKQQTARGAAGGKALYSTKAATGAGLPSSGLDELANVVASSGLASGGLANRRPSAPDPDDYAGSPPPRFTAGTSGTNGAKPAGGKLPLLIGGGALVAGLLGVIAFLVWSRPAPPPPTVVAAGQGAAPTPSQEAGPSLAGPRFLDIPLAEQKIVYLLDRGDSNKDVLDPLKAVLYESLRTLGPEREFRVVFWPRAAAAGIKPLANESAFPRDEYARANKGRIGEIEDALEDVTTVGLTDPVPAVAEAMRRPPNVIVIATAKGFNLDQSLVQQVMKARAGKSVKIHTIDLSRNAEGRPALQAIADKTGGTYRHVPPSELGD